MNTEKTEAKHTDGPWKIVTSETDQSEIYKGNGRRPSRLIGTVNHGDGELEGKANARLIAAAPEMLALLQWAIGTMPEPVHDWSVYAEQHTAARDLLDRIGNA